ncbi:MAG: para-aminobenzoate synthase, subunit [Gammaproteobacteria bacterium]|jgi:para-aminobenzoate synthetase component 1|nr:para-aminobenzoate synthase, subunit [Gammaproteobacteria bacterium]
MYFQHILPYSRKSSELFAKIRHRPHAVFLQSAAKSVGRYDIISANPTLTVTATTKKTSLLRDNILETIASDPLDFLIAQLPPTLPPSPYPFIGGILGYWSYDWGVQLHSIQRRILPHHSLPLLHLGLYDWAIIVDHQTHTTTYVSYNLDKDHEVFLEDLLSTAVPTADTAFQLQGAWKSNIDYTTYQQQFLRIQEHLHAGDCYQVNFSQRFFSHYEGDPWQAYQRLMDSCSAAFCAYLNCSDHHILSLSPERLLKVTSDKKVEAKPIKGTRPRGKTAEEDQQWALQLQHSTKDRAENIMIVDMLRNDLGRLCVCGSISVSHLCALESYHNVHHLVSSIQGQLPEDCHPLQLLRSIFPGASITGAPKKRVIEIIEALETHQRHIYCGAIGYYSADGQLDSNISIRTALCYDGRIEIAGGGGIVLDSDVAEEYAEIQNKIAAMLRSLEG